LLDFLVSQADQAWPDRVGDIFQPDAEMELVHRARRHKVSELTAELQTLLSQAEAYAKHIATADSSEPLRSRLPQVERCIESLQEASTAFAEWTSRYSSLCSWFTPLETKQRPSDEFFGFWDSFLIDLQKSWESYKKQKPQPAERARGRAKTLPPQERRRASVQIGAISVTSRDHGSISQERRRASVQIGAISEDSSPMRDLHVLIRRRNNSACSRAHSEKPNRRAPQGEEDSETGKKHAEEARCEESTRERQAKELPADVIVESGNLTEVLSSIAQQPVEEPTEAEEKLSEIELRLQATSEGAQSDSSEALRRSEQG